MVVTQTNKLIDVVTNIDWYIREEEVLMREAPVQSFILPNVPEIHSVFGNANDFHEIPS